MYSHQSMCMFLKQKKIGREPTSDQAVPTAAMYSVSEQGL
jgi:hypothetical protein